MKETKKIQRPVKIKVFNPLEFKMKFRAFFAAGIFVVISAVLILLIFDGENTYKDLVEAILTFLLGGALGAIVTFYYDGNESNQPLPPASVLPELELRPRDVDFYPGGSGKAEKAENELKKTEKTPEE